MKFTFKPAISAVRHLRDWGDFVLKSTYLAFVDSVADAMLALQEEQQLQAQALATHTHSGISNGGGSVSVDAIGNTIVSPAAGHVYYAQIESGGVYQIATANHGAAFNLYSNGNLNLGSGQEVNVSGYSKLTNSKPAQPAQTLQGAPGQTAPLLKLQQVSSTGTVRDAASIDTVVTNDSDANFTTAVAISTVSNGGALTEAVRVTANRITVNTGGSQKKVFASGTSHDIGLYADGYTILDKRYDGNLVLELGHDAGAGAATGNYFKYGNRGSGPTYPSRFHFFPVGSAVPTFSMLDDLTSEFGGDAKFTNDSDGVILKDRTTGDPHRLYVDNGVLGVEAA